MKVLIREEVGITGKTVKLSLKELEVINTKWKQIMSFGKIGRRINEVDADLINEFDHLVNKITEGAVIDYDNVHDELFGTSLSEYADPLPV